MQNITEPEPESLKLKLKLAFTPDEMRVVKAAYQKYVNTLQVFAELHGIDGVIQAAPDHSGFLE